MTVDIYSWVKAFHIIAVIAWMAGMLYLPRLFVYHCAAEKGSRSAVGLGCEELWGSGPDAPAGSRPLEPEPNWRAWLKTVLDFARKSRI
jgi:hypothetical protein